MDPAAARTVPWPRRGPSPSGPSPGGATLQSEDTYDWVIAGVRAGIGAWLASEITWTQWFTGLTDLGPQFDCLLIIPAVIGGLLLGAIVEAVARMIEAPAPNAA